MEIRPLQGVILTGEGERAFAAGADITEFQNLEAKDGEAFAVKGQGSLFSN